MSLKNILLRTINQQNKFLKIAAAAVRINHEKENHREQDQKHINYRKTIAAALLGSVVIVNTLKELEKNKPVNVSNKISGGDGNDKFEAGQKKPGLPVYRADEVMKHDNKDSCWVIYKHGVYDVTKFLANHPGGEQIMNGAGFSIEPFWNVYAMHKTPAVYQLLETFRIGNLHDDDVAEPIGDDLWANEPHRDERLIVKTQQPFNAEIPPKLIIENFDTPNELFFVRQHMPVPEIDAEEHSLQIIINNGTTSTKEIKLQDLVNMFPRVEMRAALMCAGNRRTEMSKQVQPVKGLEWQQGAVSSALWAGVLLRDVLVYCGVDPEDTAGKHVIFTGSDMDATGTHFSTSIPLEQALSGGARVLLATHMNGAPLPRDHGHPLRVVVPGAPAVRSVKWLQSITVSYEESQSHWHQKDYRSFNSSDTWETADFASAPPIYSLPVTSAICDPMDGDTCVLRDGHIEVKGYAYSGGARVLRVDVSADGGRSWRRAALRADERGHAWALWAAAVPVAEGLREIELWAKATDSNFNTQPEKFDDIWNIRGLLSNAYHKIKVKIAK